MTVLYPNLCYNEVCFIGIALYNFFKVFVVISIEVVIFM